MKKFILLFLIVNYQLSIVNCFSQVPKSFKYQAIVRDNVGNTVTSKTVYFLVSILKGSSSGTVVYSEEQQALTNQYGLVSFNIGEGTNQFQSISSINWSADKYFIKLEYKETLGGAYQQMGISQLESVPYALYSEKSGTAGPTGPTGDTGSQGISGAKGNTGATGPTGPSGTNGTNGSTGATGTQGIQGIQGVTGTTGAQGLQGIQGIPGTTGLQGIQGIQGIVGPTGLQGIQGIQGIAGLTGPTGDTGSQGIAGVKGNTGATGPSGVNGTNGINGVTGATGIQGIQGVTGATGIQGIQGIAGPTGPTGNTGLQGIAGVKGNTGATGPSGVNGTNGINGVTGPTGLAGTNGVAGVTGATGPTGIATGAWGLTGNAGTNSSTNFIGTTDSTATNTSLVFKANNKISGMIDLIHSNTTFGYKALGLNPSGSYNTAIGKNALYSNNGAGIYNTATGYYALYSNFNGFENTATGVQALRSNTSGYYNTAHGVNSLFSNLNGNNNTANGWRSMYSNTIGTFNTANGSNSLYFNTIGSYNTANGSNSLYKTTGAGNTATGTKAGFNNITGSNNTFIGYGADVTADGLTNAAAIGYNAKVSASNSLILGGTGTDTVSVGIGTTTPAYTLDVTGNGERTGNFVNTYSLGIGVYGTGGFFGVYGVASLTGSGSRYGLYGAGQNGLNNYGVQGVGYGGYLACGVFGTANGATTNWAGYFGNGHVYIQNNLGIGTTSLWSPGENARIIQLSATQYPQYLLQATNAPLNNKVWRMIARDSKVFQIQTLSDAFDNEITGFQIERSDNSITKVSFPSGNVGIGTTNPAFTLDVTGNKTITGNIVNSNGGTGVKGISNNDAGYGIGVHGEGGYIGVLGWAILQGSGSRYGIYGQADGGTTAYGVYGTASNATTNWAGFFNGDIHVSGAYNPSDRKLKNDIKPLKGAMTIINKLNPSVYKYKTNEYKQMHLPEGLRFGLIADEVKQILPGAVKHAVQPAEYENHDENKGKKLSDEVEFDAVNYTEMIPILIGGMKEQQKMIDEQQKQINELKTEIQQLKNITNNLKSNNQPISSKPTEIK